MPTMYYRSKGNQILLALSILLVLAALCLSWLDNRRQSTPPEKFCDLVVPVVLQDYPGHVPEDETDVVLLGIGERLAVLGMSTLEAPVRYYRVQFDAGSGVVRIGFVPETSCAIVFVIPKDR